MPSVAVARQVRQSSRGFPTLLELEEHQDNSGHGDRMVDRESLLRDMPLPRGGGQRRRKFLRRRRRRLALGLGTLLADAPAHAPQPLGAHPAEALPAVKFKFLFHAGKQRLSKFLDDWEQRPARPRDHVSLEELAFLAYGKCLAAVPEVLLPLDAGVQKRLRAHVQAIQERVEEPAARSGMAAFRWTLEDEYVSPEIQPGRLLDRHAEGVNLAAANMTPTPLRQIYLSFLEVLRSSWPWKPSPSQEDEMDPVPLTASHKRGNYIFAAWLVGSSALFMMWSRR
ncbi:unnamed protein product [Effrenium voratum]|nr:unnamed protein product [Effrenium voratum]